MGIIRYLVAEIWFGPTISLLYEFVEPRRRGTAQGLFSVLTAVGNVAPVAIGAAVSARVPLPDALALSIAPCYAAAALAFAGAARVMTDKPAAENGKGD
jgi:peptidoglycan/LPS O-acetylase OafA/YrhL